MKIHLHIFAVAVWAITASITQAEDALVIMGSDTFSEELGPQLISAFEKQYPSCDVQLDGLGSASGISALLNGTCDMAASSRMLNDNELRKSRSKNLELNSTVAGFYGVGLVVNQNNPLKNLSDKDIEDIFTGTIRNWKQVGGPDQPIHVLIRDSSGGTHLEFRELAMENHPYAASAQGYSTSSALTEAVAKDPDAIGYIGMNHLSAPGIHSLSINGVSPNDATVKEGLYPYIQTIWLYSRSPENNPEVERFMRFVRSGTGQEIVGNAGFVSPDHFKIDGKSLFFLVFAVLGGLALFIYGMNIMTEGLRTVAGQRLRSILSVMTTRRLSGLAMGTVLGTLIHSSATTVMLVGFIQAGLMNLIQAMPVMLGCNVGTTLSMQLISFKLSDYALFAVAVGFIISMISKTTKRKQIGLSLMGFGLLFLGMTIMSEAIKPHRELLKPLMAGISADTPQGMLFGILLATLLTSIIQSSGATIGMCFALVKAGVLTSIDQTMPIILGAHIGTCATALLGSIGTSLSAKRLAYSHLIFNIVNVTGAVLLKVPLIWVLTRTSSDLVRQSANLHSLVMITAAAIFLPFSTAYAKLILRIFKSRKPEPEPSYLEDELLDYPEKAICASINELQRVARTCEKSLQLTGQTILFVETPKGIHAIHLNERVVNDIKVAMKEYLSSLTRRYLSKRQAILIQHIDRCIVDLERIGDHIETLCDLSVRRQKVPEAVVDQESFDAFFALYEKTLHIFNLVIESLNPDKENFQEMARAILQARDEYMEASLATRALFTDKVAQRVITSIAGIFFSEYIAALDRIVKHSKSIALAEREPQFWIKHSKLEKHVNKAPVVAHQQLVDPAEYLSRIHSDES